MALYGVVRQQNGSNLFTRRSRLEQDPLNAHFSRTRWTFSTETP
jgi:hypothetical protein